MKRKLLLGTAISIFSVLPAYTQSFPMTKRYVNTEKLLGTRDSKGYVNRTLPPRVYTHYFHPAKNLKWIAVDAQFKPGLRYGSYEMRIHPSVGEKANGAMEALKECVARTIYPDSKQKLIITITQYSDLYQNVENGLMISYPFFIYEAAVVDPDLPIKVGTEQAVFENCVAVATILDFIDYPMDPGGAPLRAFEWRSGVTFKWNHVLEEIFKTTLTKAAMDH